MRTVKLFYRFLEDKNLVFDNPAHRLPTSSRRISFSEPCSPKAKCNAFLAVPDLTRPCRESGTGLARSALLHRHPGR